MLRASETKPITASISSQELASLAFSLSPLAPSSGRETAETTAETPTETAKAPSESHAGSGTSNPTEPTEPATLTEQPKKEKEKPLVETTFKIPDSVLEKIKDSNEKRKDLKTPPQYFSFNLYRGPNDEVVKVAYCCTKVEVEHNLDSFFKEKVIGFDLEWPYPMPRGLDPIRYVSLIQIASQDRILLAHISMHPGAKPSDLIGPKLKSLLLDSKILKVGVNIGGDAKRMDEYLDTTVKGLFELSHLYRLVRFGATESREVNKKLVSLANQCYYALKLPLSKDDNVRCSSWQTALTKKQIVYAASDAYVGLMVFLQLDQLRRDMDPCPPRPALLEEKKPIILPRKPSIFKKASEAATKAKPGETTERKDEKDQEGTLEKPAGSASLTRPVLPAGTTLNLLNVSIDSVSSVGSVVYPDVSLISPRPARVCGPQQRPKPIPTAANRSGPSHCPDFIFDPFDDSDDDVVLAELVSIEKQSKPASGPTTANLPTTSAAPDNEAVKRDSFGRTTSCMTDTTTTSTRTRSGSIDSLNSSGSWIHEALNWWDEEDRCKRIKLNGN